MGTVRSKDGTTIAYSKTGNSRALVLVDGAFCYREHGVTPNLLPLLTSSFTVYSYDRRGRGQSNDTSPYSVDKEIDDLRAIVDVTNEIPYILGLSSGAALLIQAVNKGIKAEKIALFEPPYVVVNENDIAPPENAKEALETLVAKGRRGDAVKYFMVKVMGMPAIFVWLFKMFGGKLYTRNEGVAHTLPYDIAIMGNFSVPKVHTSNITLPTLVIGGERSPKKLLNAVKNTAANISGAEICLLKGQSHNTSMKVLAPAIINFFKRTH